MSLLKKLEVVHFWQKCSTQILFQQGQKIEILTSNNISHIYLLAASPLAPSGGTVGRGCAPPNHQVQLRCNTEGASPHFSEKKITQPLTP